MQPEDPQNIDQLRMMLHKGMGRAVLSLMNQNIFRYQDLLLDSCLHNYAYDPQFEETRAYYLYQLIRTSAGFETYRQEILKALDLVKESRDAEQLLDFAVLFARDGDDEARKAIYEKVRKNDTDTTLTGDDQLMELDGVTGLIFLLDITGQDQELMENYVDDYLITKAEKTSTTGKVRLALRRAAKRNPNVAMALSSITDYSPEWPVKEILRRRKEKRNRLLQHIDGLSASTTWEEVKNSQDYERLVFHWPRYASAEELEKAARDIDPGEEPKKLQAHLRIFDKYPFPLEPDILISLVDHPNDRVAISAISALEIVQHKKVRCLLNDLLNKPKWSDRAIGLVRSNYESSDDKLIIELLEKENDPDRLHLMCIQVMDVYEDNPISDGLQPLLLVHEKTPCSVCRCTCIHTIRDIAKVPDWMINEAAYDAYSETRELAVKLKQEYGA